MTTQDPSLVKITVYYDHQVPGNHGFAYRTNWSNDTEESGPLEDYGLTDIHNNHCDLLDAVCEIGKAHCTRTPANAIQTSATDGGNATWIK